MEPPEGTVWPALAAAGLLVAQQVAAKATRDALFLSTFPVTWLPLVSAGAAAVSLGGVLAFSRQMARSSPPRLLGHVLVLNAGLLAGQWALSRTAPSLVAVTLYLHVGVFGATVLSGFWSVVNERFDPYSARRAVGRIGAGAALGGVLGGLLTWRTAAVTGLPAMLLVLAVLPAAALLALRRLDAGTPGVAAGPSAASVASGAARALGSIRGHAYLRHVALLVGLGAVAETVLEYVLNARVAAAYERGAPLTSFFALYHTALGLGTLAVQATLARRALERLGVAGTLAAPATWVACGSAVAAFWPGFWPPVLLRGTQAVLARSLYRSAYELLYTPMAPQRKRPLKVLLDVGADRAGTIVGAAVTFAVLLGPIRVRERLLLVLAAMAAAGSLLLARRLHRGYVAALAESVRTGAQRLQADSTLDPVTRASLPRVEAASAPAPPGVDEKDTDAAHLRSGEPLRARPILAREQPLAAELVPLAIPLLARDELFAEAVGALRRVGERCTGQLLDVLLDPEQDPVVRRRVPRVLKAVRTQRSVDGLASAMRDERFDVRYRSAQALLRLRGDASLRVPEPEALAAAQRELAGSKPSTRGLEHVMTLLSLARPGEPLTVALRAWRSGDRALRGTALEYLENLLPAAVWAGLWPWLGARPASSGRTLDEVRDDLLRSTTSWTQARRSRSGPA